MGQNIWKIPSLEINRRSLKHPGPGAREITSASNFLAANLTVHQLMT